MNIRNSCVWSFITRLGLVMVVLVLAAVANASGRVVEPKLDGNSEDAFIQVYGAIEEDFESGPFTATVHYDNGCDYTYAISGNNVSDPPPETGGDFIPGMEGCGNVASVTITQGNGESITAERDNQGRGIEVCFRLWRWSWTPWRCFCISFNSYSGRLYIRTYFKWGC